MLYIVIGANGHLGNVISNQLRMKNEIVFGLILPGDDASRLESIGVNILRADISEKMELESVFEQLARIHGKTQTCLIHTAGIISIQNKKTKKLVEVNVTGTRNLLELSIKYKIGHFIYVSSVHAIEEKRSGITYESYHFDEEKIFGAYAKTKATATQLCQEARNKGLHVSIVHPSGIIGPYDYNDAHMTMTIQHYLNNKLKMRIKGKYDFVDVRDVARAIIKISKLGIYDNFILSGHLIELKQMFDDLRVIGNKKRKLSLFPTWILKLLMPVINLYYSIRKEKPLFTKYSIHTLESNVEFSHEKATVELGYKPREIYDTLKDTALFLAKQGRVVSKDSKKYLLKNGDVNISFF